MTKQEAVNILKNIMKVMFMEKMQPVMAEVYKLSIEALEEQIAKELKNNNATQKQKQR